jgi:hypothetical protein
MSTGRGSVSRSLADEIPEAAGCTGIGGVVSRVVAAACGLVDLGAAASRSGLPSSSFA